MQQLGHLIGEHLLLAACRVDRASVAPSSGGWLPKVRLMSMKLCIVLMIT